MACLLGSLYSGEYIIKEAKFPKVDMFSLLLDAELLEGWIDNPFVEWSWLQFNQIENNYFLPLEHSPSPKDLPTTGLCPCPQAKQLAVGSQAIGEPTNHQLQSACSQVHQSLTSSPPQLESIPQTKLFFRIFVSSKLDEFLLFSSLFIPMYGPSLYYLSSRVKWARVIFTD